MPPRIPSLAVSTSDSVTGGVSAPGWEWWSVQDNGNCTALKLWRGTMPIGTESYASTPAGDCNGCHSMIKDTNDSVYSSALQLAHF